MIPHTHPAISASPLRQLVLHLVMQLPSCPQSTERHPADCPPFVVGLLSIMRLALGLAKGRNARQYPCFQLGKPSVKVAKRHFNSYYYRRCRRRLQHHHHCCCEERQLLVGNLLLLLLPPPPPPPLLAGKL